MGRHRLNFPRYPGPTGAQALRAYIKMIGNGRTLDEVYSELLAKYNIPALTGRNWIYHGNLPRGIAMRKVERMTEGWVTSTEWVGDRPMQPKWEKRRTLWEEEKP